MVSHTRLTELRRLVNSRRGRVDRARKSVENAKKAQRRADKLLTEAKTESAQKSRTRAANKAADKVRSAEAGLAGKEKQLNKWLSQLSKAEGEFSEQQAKKYERSISALDAARKGYERERVAHPKGLQEKATDRQEWDIFISHSSEDKESFVRLLVYELTAVGLRVWYDEATLRVGDSLRQKIDEGLARSRFGIVVISHSFFAKQWPQYELDGLVTRQNSNGAKVILPIWHNISRDEVLSFSPSLAGLVALNTSVATLTEIADEIARAVSVSSEE